VEKDNLIQDMYTNHVKEYSYESEQWFGPLTSFKLRHDPKYLVFMLSRYKAASKFLLGKKNILEVGCGDGVGVSILLQESDSVHAVDLEKVFIEDNIKRNLFGDSVKFSQHDMIKKPLNEKYDGVVSFDVLSSIPKDKEDDFFSNIANSMDENGIFVIGTQNVLSTPYSSNESMKGQDNFKDYDSLMDVCKRHFKNVIILSMNDEVIHTGRETMTQYFVAICVSPA